MDIWDEVDLKTDTRESLENEEEIAINGRISSS